MDDLDRYLAAPGRYDAMTYRRCGRSGLLLPAVSLGLWHNFGDDAPVERQRAILRRAFDLGITHIDLANNYGPPYGSAELNFGRIFAQDFRPYRDEMVLSTKAGYDMWPGPYGEWGSRKYLLASLDQSLARMGVDYVDIFYSHRFDPHTRSRRPWGRWPPPSGPAARSTPASRPTRPSARAKPSRSCGRWGRRCSSTSPATRCSTGGWRMGCSTSWAGRASGASRSPRSPRACSPTGT